MRVLPRPRSRARSSPGQRQLTAARAHCCLMCSKRTCFWFLQSRESTFRMREDNKHVVSISTAAAVVGGQRTLETRRLLLWENCTAVRNKRTLRQEAGGARSKPTYVLDSRTETPEQYSEIRPRKFFRAYKTCVQMSPQPNMCVEKFARNFIFRATFRRP